MSIEKASAGDRHPPRPDGPPDARDEVLAHTVASLRELALDHHGAARRSWLYCGRFDDPRLEALLLLAEQALEPPRDVFVLPDPWLDDDTLARLAGRGNGSWARLAALLQSGSMGALPGLTRHELALPATAGSESGPGTPPRRFHVTLGRGDPDALLDRIELQADLIVHGTTAAPQAMPRRLRALARLAAPGAPVLLPAPAAQAPLPGRAGLRPRARAGPPGALDLRWPVVERPAGRAAAVPGPALAEGATVAVVGAGLAGSACAAVFAARGWRVVLLDACERPRIGGGQPLLADHPHLAPDDNPLARLTRHALAAAWRWRGDRRPQGRLQLAHDATEAHRQARAVAALGPGAASFVRCVDADEASVLAGIRLDRGGLWLPLCGALDPLPLARFWTERPGVSRRFGRRVAALARHDEGWRMLAPDGSELARADAVVLATADAVAGIARLRHLPLQRLRGQSTRIRAASLTDLRCIVAGRGYVCPIGDGDVLVGASTDTREAGLPEPDDDLANLARLRGLVAALPDRETGLQMLGGSVGTRVTAPDRLPVIGELADEAAVRADAARHLRNDRLPLPRLPRLHALCGLGARGLLWAPLGAELIADRLAGTPPALERDLLAAIDPARFLRHALRQGQPV